MINVLLYSSFCLPREASRFLDLLGEVLLQVFCHTETSDLLSTKNLCHGVVGGEKLFILWVLEVLLLQVGPQTLRNLGYIILVSLLN